MLVEMAMRNMSEVTSDRLMWMASFYEGWLTAISPIRKSTSKNPYVRTKTEKRRIMEREQERAWFFASDTFPGSFLWYCDLLNFDPGVIRAQLQKFIDGKINFREYKKRLRECEIAAKCRGVKV